MAARAARAGRRSGTRAWEKRGNPSVRRFNRNLLPSPRHYYNLEFGTRLDRKGWVSTRCPFHEDKSPSLSVNLATGGYVCHACGAKGGDVLDFHMRRYGLEFLHAADELGCLEVP